ncbi:MAG: tetratricopeptide repeat protein [Oscillibacter sp.]|nr:tetratricopeptide repeat protein [Oscillibacter sp.]
MKSGEIFISYSHNDKERVFSVLDAMRARGYRFWYDADIQAGRQWTDELAASIAECAVFVPFVSDSYGASEYCMQEIRHAKRKKATISPVFLTDTGKLSDNLRYQLEDLHGFSLKSASPGDFVAWMDRQEIFCPCRDTPAETVAELVTNERPVSASASFVGRADILRDIEAAFRDGETIVNLYGMGGIGKSEICRKLYHDRADALSRYVGWLTWHDTLQNTLYAQFRDIREDNAARYLQLAREYVRDKGRGLLIFLDNADTMTPRQAAELSTLGCRFLVTSRRQQERFFGLHAGTLPPEDCRVLYRRALYRKRTLSDASPDPTLDEILRLAAWHTLTVELLAKTQRAAGLDAQELLDKLRESGFDLTGVEEEIEYDHRPELGGDGDGHRTFLEHMTIVFDLSKLRETPKETFLQKVLGFFRKRNKASDALRVLQGMSLLAPNEYIPVKTVKKWLDLPNLNGLNRAADTGWLNEKTESDGTRAVSIHPVVAAVVQRNAPPDADYVDAVAGRLYRDMIVDVMEVFVDKLPMLKHALTLHRVAQSMDLQTENYAGMLHQMGYLNYYQGNYADALEWYQKALRICETVFGTDTPNTATTYNNIALVYKAQGNYDSALEWSQEALRITETMLGKDHSDTAITYSNIAGIYWVQGDYDSSLKWNQKALRIRETVFGTEHPHTARTYNNIALVYCKQRDYASSWTWFQKALRIRETVLGQNHPETARTYNTAALFYYEQGDYASSLEWYQKALRIRETVLGKGHPDTAATYHSIGAVYFGQRDFQEAVKWLEKAILIRMKVLGSEHPKTKDTQEWLNAARERMTQEGTP